MKLLTIGIAIFIFHIQQSSSREVTHGDIRDAMLSLMNIVGKLDNKLERHEARERALGEQIKRTLASLEKGHRSLDPLKGSVSRLDERLSNVETILIQKDEREKLQTEKTSETLDKLKSSMQSWSDNIANTVRAEIKAIPKPVINNNETVTKLKELDKSLSKKIDAINPYTEKVVKKSEDTIKHGQVKDTSCKKSNLDEDLLNKQLAQIEKLLVKFDAKLTEHDANITKLQADLLPLNEVAIADEAWHNKMANVIEKQNTDLQKIQKSIDENGKLVKSIPSLSDINNSNNQTIEAINKIQDEIIKKSEENVMKITPSLLEIKKHTESIDLKQNEIIKNITDECRVSEDTYANVIKSYELLKTELQSLSKVERVMIQTADNVLDIKRRIEYGIHQISTDFTETVKSHGVTMNKTMNKRFDDIEMSIVESQTDALGNLTKKIEHEMSQVWRQIGIMYKELTSSSNVLDRLQAQTEQYVNGSTTTMDGMEGKVGLITKRMTEIDENLNYLLGRLSLITQEFNQIKDGLGNALDSIKSSFAAVQSKIKDPGPGPHQINRRFAPNKRFNET